MFGAMEGGGMLGGQVVLSAWSRILRKVLVFCAELPTCGGVSCLVRLSVRGMISVELAVLCGYAGGTGCSDGSVVGHRDR